LLVLVATVGLLTAIGCVTSTSRGYHHDRTSGTQSVVYARIPDWHDGFENPVRAGISAWSASPRVAVYFRRTCPAAPANCVKVGTDQLANSWAGLTYFGSDSSKHVSDSTRIELDIDLIYASPATVQQVACHEWGHALGLDHGPGGSLGGPCVKGKPTAWDLELIRQAYNHRDSCCTPGV
jgi:hypothetical protein